MGKGNGRKRVPLRDESIGFALERAASVYRAKLREHAPGVSMTRLAVLDALTGGPLSQQQIVEITGSDRSSVSAMLAYLVRKGRVAIVANTGDLRTNTVTLTEDGIGAWRRGREAVETLECTVLDGVEFLQRLRGVMDAVALIEAMKSPVRRKRMAKPTRANACLSAMGGAA